MDFGDIDDVGVFEVAPQFGRVRRFPDQIEFVERGFFEFGDHFERPQAARIGPEALGKAGQFIEQRNIGMNTVFDVGPEHLDHDVFAGMQFCGMHLRDRGRSQRRWIEVDERRVDRHAQFDSMIRRATSFGNGGTRSCSLTSSSAISSGNRSLRVDSAWPNLT